MPIYLILCSCIVIKLMVCLFFSSLLLNGKANTLPTAWSCIASDSDRILHILLEPCISIFECLDEIDPRVSKVESEFDVIKDIDVV